MSTKATRMNLLLTKRKLKLATKGHKLLKEKRDALVMEFFAVLKEVKALRFELGDKFSQAQKALTNAENTLGMQEIERLSLNPGSLSYKTSSRTIMNVHMPEITDVKAKKEWYGHHESPLELDNAAIKYQELLPTLLRLSAKQLALNRLAEEIRKTKRKVNSLEYNIMPRLEDTKKFITFKLEEYERENFTRLKKIKEGTEE